MADRKDAGTHKNRLIAAIALVLVAAALIAWWLVRDDDDRTATTTSTTTTQASTTSSVMSPTVVDTSAAIWPFDGSSERFKTPEDAARSFAKEYVKFTSPVVGSFRQGDSRSGEVDVRPRENGPVTTVLVRQLEDDNWWVIGSATPNIQISQPTALAIIKSPMELRGMSTAFEGNVQTEVRVEDSTSAHASGYVTGGSMGELGPFTGNLSFPAPTTDYGTVLMFTESAENGQVWEASVVRIRFER